jgi:hypothetical protein
MPGSNWIRKLQARFFAGDYQPVLDASLRSQRLLWSGPANLALVFCHIQRSFALVEPIRDLEASQHEGSIPLTRSRKRSRGLSRFLKRPVGVVSILRTGAKFDCLGS